MDTHVTAHIDRWYDELDRLYDNGMRNELDLATKIEREILTHDFDHFGDDVTVGMTEGEADVVLSDAFRR